MNNFLIVSNVERLKEHKDISEKYGVGFEINDFYNPDVLDDDTLIDNVIERYNEIGVPPSSTLHGAFYDVILFSYDKNIRENSKARMRLSMDIASELGVASVVFHTNYNPSLSSECYDERVVEYTVKYLSELLKTYPAINIYLENMFDERPDIICEISKKLSQYKNFGVCFDYAHATIYGESMDEWIKMLHPYIKHIHINDNNLKKDMHLAVGKGLIDWKLFEKYYKDYFANATVLIETTMPSEQAFSLEYIKNNIFKGDII